MPNPEPIFRLWIRRDPASDQPYSIRFEVFEGKGLLRTPRAPGQVDPEPRDGGFEKDLSGDRVRSTRFVLVGPRGNRKRILHEFTTISDQDLSQLPEETWHDLVVVDAGGYRFVELPKGPKPRAETAHELDKTEPFVIKRRSSPLDAPDRPIGGPPETPDTPTPVNTEDQDPSTRELAEAKHHIALLTAKLEQLQEELENLRTDS